MAMFEGHVQRVRYAGFPAGRRAMSNISAFFCFYDKTKINHLMGKPIYRLYLQLSSGILAMPENLYHKKH